jgi:hypothetical protein
LIAFLGDPLKKILLLSAMICLAALVISSLAMAADAQTPKRQILNSYEGNITQKEIAPVDMLSFFGRPGYFIAETVKFRAPKPGWKLDEVQLFGWDGFNGTIESIPRERVIALEVRDKDRKLLYRFTDSQLPYTNYAQNATGVYPITIELPPITVSDEFYISFYDRGAVAVASERLNETSKNSFLYIEAGDELIPANLPIGENKTIPINWIMSVGGS